MTVSPDKTATGAKGATTETTAPSMGAPIMSLTSNLARIIGNIEGASKDSASAASPLLHSPVPTNLPPPKAPPPPPPVHPGMNSATHHPHGRWGKGLAARIVRRVGGTIKTSLALVGLAAVGVAYQEYKALQAGSNKSNQTNPSVDPSDASTATKSPGKVLVIPFHRLKIVEQKKSSLKTDISKVLSKLESGNSSSSQPLTMELRELVDLIHSAAADPEITVLYGIFGHGSILRQAGWADLEEIRTALRVFRESHRRHAEPNLQHGPLVIPRPEKKAMYCYADTFDCPGDPSNKDYYLASMFPSIHVQQNGDFSFLGLSIQKFFLRDFLERHGIVVHAFKHGVYKNAPNMFTESGYNRPHRDNDKNLLESVHADICQDLVMARWKQVSSVLSPTVGVSSLSSSAASQGAYRLAGTNKKQTAHMMQLWKRIQQQGSFPGTVAWKAGLVDFIPRRDPLPDLVHYNKRRNIQKNSGSAGMSTDMMISAESEDVEHIKSAWKPEETDFDHFKAAHMITLQDYAKQVTKINKAKERRRKWHDYAKNHPTLQNLLHQAGMIDDPSSMPPHESIALLYVNEPIMHNTALTLTESIRKIRRNPDIKCVVVRVTSPGGTIAACETIVQELNSLKVPTVFSFGNVSASGGYYIATSAERIFASRKTITGSIGVFGLRVDLRGLAAKYGINVQHVVTSELAPMYDPFHGMTNGMKRNISDSIDRYYDHFKTLVAEGRHMSPQEVEKVAQGRIWTGIQALDHGLIDEIGGLSRAIAYAQRSHTTTGNAQVVLVGAPTWRDWAEQLTRDFDESYGLTALEASMVHELHDLSLLSPFAASFQSTRVFPSLTLTGAMITMDENEAIRCLISDATMSRRGPH